MTLTTTQLDALPVGAAVRCTTKHGRVVLALKVGIPQGSGGHIWRTTEYSTLPSSFAIAQANAVPLDVDTSTTTEPEAEALASVAVPVCVGDEPVEMACAWSDFRKDYGVSADESARAREHQAFMAGWLAASGRLDAGGSLR
jgi:hypothetical protein